MQVVKKQVSKKKWSLSNLMTVVHILFNSYVNLYDFLNLPEGQWLKIIKNRSPEEDIHPQLEFFPKDTQSISSAKEKTMVYFAMMNNWLRLRHWILMSFKWKAGDGVING